MPKTYGTSGGVPITDDVIERLATAAERGLDHQRLRPRGRPPLGASAANVTQVRLPPDLSEALARRAARDQVGASEVIRQALREYLGFDAAQSPASMNG
jgi:CRISPR-associated endonuclease/helicase Cas3